MIPDDSIQSVDEQGQPDFEYLKGKLPTEKQLRHLREDLFYEGPDPNDAYEASQRINALYAEPAIQIRRDYENRLKEGPNWLVWEKWMLQSRKEYNKEQFQIWWSETQELGQKVGIIPPRTPENSFECEKGIYSTTEELLNEVRQVISAPKESVIRLELSVGNLEEAILIKRKIAKIRESLVTIDEDASWMLSRIREARLGDHFIAELFQANTDMPRRVEHLQIGQFRIMKKALIKCYTYVRGEIKSIKSQMRSFAKSVNEVYMK